MKKCTKCKESKDISEFQKDRSRSDGLQARCRKCDRLQTIIRQIKNGKWYFIAVRKPPKKIKTKRGHRRCRRCKNIHPKAHFYPNGALITNCQPCRDYKESEEYIEVEKIRKRTAMDKFRAANPEKIKATYREWAKNNRKEYHAKRMKNEPEYALSFRIRDILARTLRSSKTIASVANAEEKLGYTAKELKSHLQSRFENGMTWKNRGAWHIDHIKPIAQFIKEGIIDPAIINSLDNLQPLWAIDNLSKGSKYNQEE